MYIKKKITQHFTITNVTLGFLGLLFSFLFKYSGLPVIFLDYFLEDPTDNHIYLFCGSVAIISKLGLKGVVEDLIRELFPKHLTMDSGNLNSESLPQAGSAQPAQPAQPVAQPPANNIGFGNNQIHPDVAWDLHNHQGNGFRVTNGDITVDNPTNIRSFFNNQDQPNNSLAGKEYADRIYRALSYHSTCVQRKAIALPILDNSADAWFNGFIRHNYPNRDPNAVWNSTPVRKAIKSFSN